MLPGFKLTQPVSDIVEISVQTRPISNPRCEPAGSTPEVINPCQLFETESEHQQEKTGQAETHHQRQQMFQENYDQKETKSALLVIAIMIGAFLWADALVFLYVFIITSTAVRSLSCKQQQLVQ